MDASYLDTPPNLFPDGCSILNPLIFDLSMPHPLMLASPILGASALYLLSLEDFLLQIIFRTRKAVKVVKAGSSTVRLLQC